MFLVIRSTPSPGDLTPTEYRALAEFRYQIRRFLRFSEEQARSSGLEPRQHQLLLAIKGLPPDKKPTVSEICSRLQLRHHSTVELVNRLVERGVAVRKPSDRDRREVLVELTPLGEDLLHRLSVLHWQELQSSGPELARSLADLLGTQPFIETQARRA